MLRFAYYPGCSLEGSAKEYNLSLRVVCEHLGIELKEIPGWICCGASSAHQIDSFLNVLLPAKNLLKAQKMGLPVVAPCAACFLKLKQAKKAILDDKGLKKDIERVFGETFRGEVEVYHPLQVLSQPELKERIKRSINKPLSGLKLVSYYGCFLVRPKHLGIDDPENPKIMDDLLKLTGAQLLDWSGKTECCGGTHAFLRQEIVRRLVGRLCSWAKEEGAEGIVTACPLCQINLEMYQEDAGLSVYYFTELLGMSMGVELSALRRSTNPCR